MVQDTAPFVDGLFNRRVLDEGILRLQGALGGDSTICRAARVSNGVFDDKSPEQDQKLINYLIRHCHGTPFEHSTYMFYVKCPLFVRSEWMRHRMASYNEISGRYVKYEPEFYIPDRWRVKAATNKQGSVFPEGEDIGEWDKSLSEVLENTVKEAYRSYEYLLECGVAKEMARMVLPANLYTQFYFTINARGLMNFLSLRNSDDAQWEIQQYAKAIEDIFENMLPQTYKAWVANERVAP